MECFYGDNSVWSSVHLPVSRILDNLGSIIWDTRRRISVNTTRVWPPVIVGTNDVVILDTESPYDNIKHVLGLAVR